MRQISTVKNEFHVNNMQLIAYNNLVVTSQETLIFSFVNDKYLMLFRGLIAVFVEIVGGCVTKCIFLSCNSRKDRFYYCVL